MSDAKEAVTVPLNSPAPTTYLDAIVAGAEMLYRSLNQGLPLWREQNQSVRARYCCAFAAGLSAYLRAETTSPNSRTTGEKT